MKQHHLLDISEYVQISKILLKIKHCLLYHKAAVFSIRFYDQRYQKLFQINKNNQIKHFPIHIYVPTLVQSSNAVAVECDRRKPNWFSESRLFSVKYS